MLAIKYLPIEELIPYKNNARTHSEKQIEQIAVSLEKFGFTNPVLLDGKKGIVAGHGRLLAAKKLGLDKIPTIDLQFASDAEKSQYIIADNKLALNAGWDLDLLNVEFDLIEDAGLNLIDTGFADDELEKIRNPNIINEGLCDEDEIPEITEKPKTQMGDVWLLGNHRLMCGDSTILNNVDILMQDKRADAAITDPPYSVNYELSEQNGKREKNRNPTKKVIEMQAHYHEQNINPSIFLDGFVGILPTDVFIWSYVLQKHFFIIADVLRKHHFELKKELVWVKDTFSFWAGAKYQQKHEPILVCVRKGHSLNADVPANQSTVFEFPRPKKHELHPTTKPIALWELLVKYHVKPNKIVYEPFGGSGTTFIAAEKIGRICYGMEISPAYCDIIISRWQKFTGKKAILEATQKTFDEVANG